MNRSCPFDAEFLVSSWNVPSNWCQLENVIWHWVAMQPPTRDLDVSALCIFIGTLSFCGFITHYHHQLTHWDLNKMSCNIMNCIFRKKTCISLLNFSWILSLIYLKTISMMRICKSIQIEIKFNTKWYDTVRCNMIAIWSNTKQCNGDGKSIWLCYNVMRTNWY